MKVLKSTVASVMITMLIGCSVIPPRPTPPVVASCQTKQQCTILQDQYQQQVAYRQAIVDHNTKMKWITFAVVAGVVIYALSSGGGGSHCTMQRGPIIGESGGAFPTYTYGPSVCK